MGTMFKKDGTLNIPNQEEKVRHQAIIKSHKITIKSAFCPHGHDLMSSVKIDGYKGIHFIFVPDTDKRVINSIFINKILSILSSPDFNNNFFSNGFAI